MEPPSSVILRAVQVQRDKHTGVNFAQGRVKAGGQPLLFSVIAEEEGEGVAQFACSGSRKHTMLPEA